MKNYVSANEATFGPQEYKNFPGALDAFFEKQCPQMGGSLSRQALVTSIYSMVCRFFPETTHLKPGQMPWVVVDKAEKASYGKSMKQTSMVPVVIDIVGVDDIVQRKQGKRLKEMKIDAIADICQSVDKQNGCITQAELAILLKISTTTVGKYIRTWEMRTGKMLPRRGTIHDMGPTLTHKRIIIEKLFVEKLTVQETSRQTNHSFDAIHRYISSFKRALLCYRKGLTLDEIAHAQGKSKNLIKQYLEIIEEYKMKGYVLDEIEQYDAKIAPHYKENPPNELLPSELR